MITLFNRINLEIELDQLTSPLRVEAQSIGGVASSRKSEKSRSMEGVPGRSSVERLSFLDHVELQLKEREFSKSS